MLQIVMSILQKESKDLLWNLQQVVLTTHAERRLDIRLLGKLLIGVQSVHKQMLQKELQINYAFMNLLDDDCSW